MKIFEILTEGVAGPKSCWPSHRKVGTQPGTGKNKGKRVNDCEKIKEDEDDYYKLELKDIIEKHMDVLNDREQAVLRGRYWDNMTFAEIGKELGVTGQMIRIIESKALRKLSRRLKIAAPAIFATEAELGRVLELSSVDTAPADQMFDQIEEMVEAWANAHGVDPEQIWEDLESINDEELLDESAAWRNKSGKNKNGGLNAKGVASYRRENPGSKLQTAVTTKPSKLKPGSKAAKRRKSFCARMGGVKGPMKKPNGKPTRKALALRKWNC